jgi:hypothetical protein
MSNGTAPPGRPQTEAGSTGQKLGEGLSQFLGKVLDQLSITAWMPATMLVGNVAVLTQLHNQKNLDISSALVSLTDRPLGVIIVILFSVLLAAIVTQAFQYDFIRVLEGYWGAGPIRSLVADWRVRRHVEKKRRLETARERQLLLAYKAAQDRMVEGTLEAVNDLQEILTSQLSDSAKVRKIIRHPMKAHWNRHFPAENWRKVEALEMRIRHYPQPGRILPTRLGNIIRSSEYKIRELDDGTIEGFIIRNRESIPGYLMSQHDQFRNRLDMYCALVLAFLFLAIFGPMQLSSNPAPFLSHSWAAVLLYGILAVVSYGAAITSAKGYGSILIEIDHELRRKKTPSAVQDGRGYL